MFLKCSQYDLDQENNFARCFEGRFPKMKLQKLNDRQKLDFAMVDSEDGEIKGFIEFKQRSMRSNIFDVMYLNVQKWVSIRELNRATGLPCFFALGFNDGVYLMYRFNSDDRFPLTYIAEYREAVVNLPIDKFRRIA